MHQVKHPLLFIFSQLHSTMNQQLFEKHLCSQSNRYENDGRFPLCMKGSHHVLSPNWHPERCLLVYLSAYNILSNSLYPIHLCWQWKVSEVTFNSEKKIKHIALAIVQLRLSEGIRVSQSVSQLVSQSVSQPASQPASQSVSQWVSR